MAALFDMKLRAARRDRAFRTGPELFLHERVFDDCLERIALVQRRFRSAALIGCPDPQWPAGLAAVADQVEAFEPGPLFARAAEAEPIVEDEWDAPVAKYDLVTAIGTLDTVNDLPRALIAMRAALHPRGLLIGALAGGDSLPRLRMAMRAADEAVGAASAHAHPRVEAAALGPLLSAAGFDMPVVDVDRVSVSYESVQALVADLRKMGATNVLNARARTPLPRRALAAASAAFASAGEGRRTVESFEILHFMAWAPAADAREQG